MTALSPFQIVLGAEFARLPGPVHRLHSLTSPQTATGRAEITTAAGLLPRLICRLAGLPRPGRDVPVSVRFEPTENGQERWLRRFAERRYASTITVERMRGAEMLAERFGPFRLTYDLRIEDRGLRWSLAGWRLFALPLPRWSVPAVECLEGADGERFTFDIAVAFPLAGHVIRYRGWLESEAD